MRLHWDWKQDSTTIELASYFAIRLSGRKVAVKLIDMAYACAY